MRDFIERLRAHPIHIRQRIALGTTVGFTALIAVIWFGTLMTSGSLALDLSGPSGSGTVAQGTSVQGAVKETRSNFQQLAAAVTSLTGGTTTPPKLTPVDTKAPTPVKSTSSAGDDQNQNNTSQTVIPF